MWVTIDYICSEGPEGFGQSGNLDGALQCLPELSKKCSSTTMSCFLPFSLWSVMVLLYLCPYSISNSFLCMDWVRGWGLCFYIQTSSCSSTICWKDFLFFIELLGVFVGSIFGFSVLFHWSIYLSLHEAMFWKKSSRNSVTSWSGR